MSLDLQRQAGIAGVVGGLLWAVTPLRQPIFEAGRTPDEGEMVFRVYNLVLIVIAILLTIALLWLWQTRPVANRLFTVGWWIMLIGYVLVLAGSLPAVAFGDEQRDLVMGGQDVGFLGAMTSALGGLVAGVSVLVRQRRSAGLAFWLLLLTLPVGLLATVLLTAMGVHEDYLGLPLTLLYGGAWAVLGWSWLRAYDDVGVAPPERLRPETG